MKFSRFLLVASVLAAASVGAKDFKIQLDPSGDPLVKVPKEFPGFGYVCDPEVGGEDVALKYRHSGAWVLMTKKCDDRTLEFLKHYRIRVLLVLDDPRADAIAKCKHISEAGYGDALAGVLVGEKFDFANAADLDRVKGVSAFVTRHFKNVPVAIPVSADVKLPTDVVAVDAIKNVSHLVVRMPKSAAPYKALNDLVTRCKKSASPSLKKSKIWAIAPDRMPGAPEADRAAFSTSMWKIHWMLSAYAVEAVDAVLFDQPMQPDEFGQTLRYLGLAFMDHPVVMKHGESKTAETGPKAEEKIDAELSLDEESSDDYGIADKIAIEAKPKACADFAAKRGGDVEYLALIGDYRVCLVMVNTSGEPVKMTVDMKKLKSGNSTYRKMTYDRKTGKVRREAHGAYSQPALPFVARIEPDCIETVTFILTNKNYNQAGY